MNHRMILLALVVMATGIACGEPAKPTANNSQAVMFGNTPSRNMANPTAKNVPTDWSVEEDKVKNVKWAAQLGSVAYGGPVISGGKVYVSTNNERPRDPKIEGDKGIVMCFDQATGKFLWQAVHDKLPNAENDMGNGGVASTPAVEGNRLWYVSNRCELVCASTEGKDGKAEFVWKLDMIKDLGVLPHQLAACSPLVVGDLVYVVTGNGVGQVNNEFVVVNPKAPSFIAVKKTTGEVAWKSDLPGKNIFAGQWSNPSYAEINGKGQVIFPGGDGWLYAFDALKGDLIWKFDCNLKSALPYDSRERGEKKNNIVATPVVWDNKVYIGTGRTPGEDGASVGRFWCIDATKTGDLSPVKDNLDPKAEVNKNSGLVWQYGGMNPDEKSRRKFLMSWTCGSCSIQDGLVYLADYDSFVYSFDAKTGAKKWEVDLKSCVWGPRFAWMASSTSAPRMASCGSSRPAPRSRRRSWRRLTWGRHSRARPCSLTVCCSCRRTTICSRSRRSDADDPRLVDGGARPAGGGPGGTGRGHRPASCGSRSGLPQPAADSR